MRLQVKVEKIRMSLLTIRTRKSFIHCISPYANISFYLFLCYIYSFLLHLAESREISHKKTPISALPYSATLITEASCPLWYTDHHYHECSSILTSIQIYTRLFSTLNHLANQRRQLSASSDCTLVMCSHHFKLSRTHTSQSIATRQLACLLCAHSTSCITNNLIRNNLQYAI